MRRSSMSVLELVHRDGAVRYDTASVNLLEG